MARGTGALVGSIALLLALAGPASAAPPPTPEECESAYVQTQRLRKLEKRYVAAREKARLCAQESCASFVKQECTTFVSELDALIPTVIVVAREGDRDLADVALEVDGAPFGGRLDGTAAPIDPGEHTLTLTPMGRQPQTQKVVLREGERGRRLEFVWKTGLMPPAPPVRNDTPVFVVGGLTLAATLVWGTLGIMAFSDTKHLRDGCGQTRTCNQSDVDSARTKAIAADVALGFVGAGVISTIGLALLLPPKRKQYLGLSVAPTLISRSPGATLRWTF